MVLSEPLSTETKLTENMDKPPGELFRSGPYSSKYGSGVGEVEAYSIIYGIQLLEKCTVEKKRCLYDWTFSKSKLDKI